MKVSDVPILIEAAFNTRPVSFCAKWHLVWLDNQIQLILPSATPQKYPVLFVYKQQHTDHGLTVLEWSKLIGHVTQHLISKGVLCLPPKS